MSTITQTPQLCKVVYNRSTKTYQVKNGKLIAEFPHGPENKTLAQWLALEHDNAEAERIARDLVAAGADEARAIKAARLYIEGAVDLAAQTVTSSDGERVYRCWDHHCDCEDFDNGQRKRFGYAQHGAPVVDGIGVACKHTLARAIARKLAADVEAAGERKLADKIERRALSVADQKAESRAANGWFMKPDRINLSRAGAGRSEFKVSYSRD